MKPLYKDFMSAAHAITEANYTNDKFGCQMMCSFLKMSRSQAHRILKREVNMSMSEYIMKFRLEKATVLLKTTKHTINEITYTIGLSDPNYLSRMFSKIYGKPPSAFRSHAIMAKL